MGINDGRVVIVTGSGRGIGREHALAFAATGAKVVVNDLGGDARGEGGDLSPAMETVEDIKKMGGEAIANGENVADFEGAGRLVQSAIDTFGRLDVVVNNAGILRDRMLVNMVESEWDAVIGVHLKGTFGPTRHAAEYWRNEIEGRSPGRCAHRQHQLAVGNLRQRGSDELRRREGRHRGVHRDLRARARALRRHRERDRAGRAHPHDRGPRHGPGTGRRDLRRARPREHLAADRVARLARVEGRHRSRVPRRR